MPFDFPGGEAAPSLTAPLILLLAGFLVAGFGHLIESRTVVIIGLTMLFFGACFPVVAGVSR